MPRTSIAVGVAISTEIRAVLIVSNPQLLPEEGSFLDEFRGQTTGDDFSFWFGRFRTEAWPDERLSRNTELVLTVRSPAEILFRGFEYSIIATMDSDFLSSEHADVVRGAWADGIKVTVRAEQ